MPSPAHWHPVVPSHSLRAGDNLLPARVLGQDLVLWRSSAGEAQAWLDRCPHRGVRLSLGRVLDGRLSCAYHGWEFAAGGGRCTRIPALADLDAVPGRVHARTFRVREAQQMVWAELADEARTAAIGAAPGDAARSVDVAATPDDAQPACALFLRSMAVRAPLGAVRAALARHRFTPDTGGGWDGDLATAPVRVFTLVAQPDLTLLHVFLPRTLAESSTPAVPDPYDLARRAAAAATFAALRRLRADAETQATAGAR